MKWEKGRKEEGKKKILETTTRDLPFNLIFFSDTTAKTNTQKRLPFSGSIQFSLITVCDLCLLDDTIPCIAELC